MALSSSNDDLSDSFDSSGAVDVNAESTGNLEVAGDKDWFRIELLAGARYSFTMIRPDENSSLDEPFLVLRDEDGNYLLQSNPTGLSVSARLNFVPSTSGTYWLEARSVAGDTGDYKITVESQDDLFDDDFGDTRAETTLVPLNQLVAGQIDEPGDQDWLRVSLTAGQTYALQVTATEGADTSLVDLFMVVRNAAGQFAQQVGATATDSTGTATFTPSISGDYTIAVRDYGGGVGSYGVAISDQGLDRFEGVDIPGGITSTATLSVDEQLGGVITTLSDSDWYKVSLTANTEYRINVDPSDSSDAFQFDVGGVLNETKIIIRDADGAFLVEEDGFGDEFAPNEVSFIPQTTGDYWIDVRGLSDTGSYVITLSDQGESVDDFPSNTSSTGTISSNSPGIGELEVEGDSDWFSITLAGGFEHIFTVSADPNKQPPDINLVLRDSNGTFIDQYPGSADANFFVFQVQQTGKYWIEIQSVNDSLFDNIGTYEIEFLGSEALPESSSQARSTIEFEQTVQVNEADGYSVTAPALATDGPAIGIDI